MTLKVIGSGFGRTGTMSLKLALEQLGIGRCHHMFEVLQRPEATAQWIAAADGQPDWPGIFNGFSAAVDWPSATFWRELAAAYPEAKIVHTERDPDAWFDSCESTIFPAMERAPRGPWREMVEKVVLDLFDGRVHERAHATAVFRAHNDAVREAIPPERLLVYYAAEGWGPLCRFLGIDEPSAPMPKVNTREEFRARVANAGS